MKINKLTDYSIVLLSHFVSEKSELDSVLLTARELTELTELPYPTVVKLLKNLALKGLLKSRRGINGGYFLAKPARDISISDVIVASEGPIALTECVAATNLCQLAHACPTQSNWNKINVVIKTALDRLSLEEISPKTVHPQANASDKVRQSKKITTGVSAGA